MVLVIFQIWVHKRSHAEVQGTEVQTRHHSALSHLTQQVILNIVTVTVVNLISFCCVSCRLMAVRSSSCFRMFSASCPSRQSLMERSWSFMEGFQTRLTWISSALLTGTRSVERSSQPLCSTWPALTAIINVATRGQKHFWKWWQIYNNQT